MPSLALSGLSVLVSGAGGGIGRVIVETFRAAGADVTGADRTDDLLAEFAPDRRLVADLADTAATSAATAAWLARAGTPDIVVSNAGYTRAETLDDLDSPTWDAEVALNLNGAYALTGPIVEAMAARGQGSLVFVSSVNGIAHFGNPAYAAAKAGLIAYAKSIAVERGREGVRANVVAPGSVRTPAWDHRIAANPDLLGRVVPLYPLGRLVTPQEVANAVLFLASPMASGITGVTLAVDAGLTAGQLPFIDNVLRAR